VPAHPERVDGLLWPNIFQHPEDDGQAITYSFTREAMARELQGDDSPAPVLQLPGIELLRWAWGAPKQIHEVAIDLFTGSAGSVRFPAYWLMSALWPHFHDLESLEQARKVGLEKIGRGTRAGTQPHALRALVGGWQSLVPARGVDGQATVEVDGGHYLPVFSSADAFFAYDSEHEGRLAPAPKFEDSPFGPWLDDIRDLDGVVLDPGGPWPLRLGPTDLIVLERWASEHRRPHGTDLSIEVARRLDDGTMTEATAGCVLADWPRYFMCLQRRPDGSAAVLTIPDRDCCAVFSTAGRADLYLESYRQAGVIDGSWETLSMLAQWGGSIFHQLDEMYEEGGWIDPSPPGAGLLVWANNFLGKEAFELDPTLVMDGHPGVHVHGEILQAALRRTEQMLKPRVPEFVPAQYRRAA